MTVFGLISTSRGGEVFFILFKLGSGT
jgi:hypothetical protein